MVIGTIYLLAYALVWGCSGASYRRTRGVSFGTGVIAFCATIISGALLWFALPVFTVYAQERRADPTFSEVPDGLLFLLIMSIGMAGIFAGMGGLYMDRYLSNRPYTKKPIETDQERSEE